MDLPGLSVLAVDAADLGGEDEVDVGLAGCGNIVGLEFFLEREQPVARGLELLCQLLEPPRMGEVAGADDRDALELRPFPDAFGRHVLARCAGVMGMDVEVGDETHGRDYSMVRQGRQSSPCADRCSRPFTWQLMSGIIRPMHIKCTFIALFLLPVSCTASAPAWNPGRGLPPAAISVTLAPVLPEVSAKDVPYGAVRFHASIRNSGEHEVIVAHPSICLPSDHDLKKTWKFVELHGKSEILLRITRPDNRTVVLRDGHFFFDPGGLSHFAIAPGGTARFDLGWFFQNARGRWENWQVADTVFLDRGRYTVQLLFRNVLPKAAIADQASGRMTVTDVWTGEVLSNQAEVEVR